MVFICKRIGTLPESFLEEGWIVIWHAGVSYVYWTDKARAGVQQWASDCWWLTGQCIWSGRTLVFN